MPRNGSGSFSLAEAAFIPNTPITAASTNSNNDDFAEMLTDSLSRSGKGGMQTTLSLAPTGPRLGVKVLPILGRHRPRAALDAQAEDANSRHLYYR